MYLTNSGIEISNISNMITTCEQILADYGDLPIYTQDDTAGVETDVIVGYITIKTVDSKPLRILIK